MFVKRKEKEKRKKEKESINQRLKKSKGK